MPLMVDDEISELSDKVKELEEKRSAWNEQRDDIYQQWGECEIKVKELEAENERLKAEMAEITVIIKQYKQGDCLYVTAGTGEEYSKAHSLCQDAIKKMYSWMAGAKNG